MFLSSCYLGQKGFTILKKNISKIELEKLKKDLTIKPMKSFYGGTNKEDMYCVYRESIDKLYIPYNYGIEKYGKPESKIKEGTDIDLSFHGELRTYQISIVHYFIQYVLKENGGRGLLELPCAWGKTSAALYVCSKLNKKTIIVVHADFLLNQWIERINQFLPNARIGRIQGNIIDVEDKDIVLVMLQSLSMKEYPISLFESFGFTIIDEVHHISSKVFSNALFKINTKYMIGLSATMNRNDGTTFVFKYFLGLILNKEQDDKILEENKLKIEIKKNSNVLVKVYPYRVEDDDFNEVITDYRGNIQYSSMIVKLCAYQKRCEFIFSIIENERKLKPLNQIMVLAHNKSLLHSLYEQIQKRQIGSVGYFVGGMKQKELKLSNTKEIILATYSMASEAYDNENLNTVLFATSKPNVIQPVGRILRDLKREQPTILDVVDSHQVFKNHFKKRISYYKKQNFKIIHQSNEIEKEEEEITEFRGTGKLLIEL
jgi:superfamily II DNA or RNA helicase